MYVKDKYEYVYSLQNQETYSFYAFATQLYYNRNVPICSEIFLKVGHLRVFKDHLQIM